MHYFISHSRWYIFLLGDSLWAVGIVVVWKTVVGLKLRIEVGVGSFRVSGGQGRIVERERKDEEG